MIDPQKLRRGNALIYHNRVLKVVKTVKNKKRDDTNVIARPYFKQKNSLATEFSIPFKAFEAGNIRDLDTKTKINAFLRELQAAEVVRKSELLVADMPATNLTTEELVSVIHKLWDEQEYSEGKFPTTKVLYLRTVLNMFSSQVGAVLGLTFDQAKEKVLGRLRKRPVLEKPE